MDEYSSTSAELKNLAELRGQSVMGITLLALCLGYAWLMVLLWPSRNEAVNPFSWLGSVTLVLLMILVLLLHRQYLQIAILLLIGGLLFSVTCLIMATGHIGLGYLYLPVIVLAGILFSPGPAFIVSFIAGALVILLELVAFSSRSPTELSVLLVVMALTSVASWLAARNLYTALTWVWNGYEIARANEQRVRERSAELRQALKALDEATWRLERANEALALARDQAEEARRLKQQFVQTISHELRTPLNLIVGFTELMAQSPEYYGAELTPAYLRDLSIVHRNAKHLQRMVNDVLDLARVDAMQMTLTFEEVDPATLVEEAVATVRSMVEAAGLELRVEIAPGLPRFWVDPTRIRQVLFNLLNNAIRFTERGHITITARAQEDAILFSVSDTGVGIAPEDLPRIFQEFVQVDGSTRRRHGGAGLGLAICHRFVTLHHGRIWAESAPGVGSTFYFLIPLDSRGSYIPSLGGPEAVRRGSGLKKDLPLALAVTRNANMATLLTRYVRECRVLVVPNPDDARRVARQMSPDAVILDMTPDGESWNAFESVAETWNLPHALFLGFALDSDALCGQKLDSDGYLVKPISREALWDILRRFGERVDNVLVVDDDHDFVWLLTRMLDDPVRRYNVMSAYSGQEALSLLAVHRPDLIFLDVGLPDMDGFEILARLRTDPVSCSIPVIIISARADVGRMEIAARAMSVVRSRAFNTPEIVRWTNACLAALLSRGAVNADPARFELPVEMR